VQLERKGSVYRASSELEQARFKRVGGEGCLRAPDEHPRARSGGAVDVHDRYRGTPMRLPCWSRRSASVEAGSSVDRCRHLPRDVHEREESGCDDLHRVVVNRVLPSFSHLCDASSYADLPIKVGFRIPWRRLLPLGRSGERAHLNRSRPGSRSVAMSAAVSCSRANLCSRSLARTRGRVPPRASRRGGACWRDGCSRGRGWSRAHARRMSATGYRCQPAARPSRMCGAGRRSPAGLDPGRALCRRPGAEVVQVEMSSTWNR
jgi:hypothetical protein